MPINDQEAGFYYRVESEYIDIGRIRNGDLVWIDTKCEATPGSIILIATPCRELRRMTEQDKADLIVGKISQVHFNF